MIARIVRRFRTPPSRSIIHQLELHPYDQESQDLIGEGDWPEGWDVPAEDLIQEQFDFAAPSEAKRLVIILSTQRSGSTFLCESLAALGFGRPHEYFQDSQYMQILARRWPFVAEGRIDWPAFVHHLREKRTTPNGVLAVNVHGRHLPKFMRALPHMEDLEKLCVVVSRHNVLEQAISLNEARQTRRWSAHYSSLRAAQYDYPGTKYALFQIQEQMAKIEAFMEVLGAPVMRVHYEDLTADPPSVLASITGMDPASVAAALEAQRGTSLSKQADAAGRKATLLRFASDYLSDRRSTF